MNRSVDCFRAGVVQMCSGKSVAANIDAAAGLIDEAANAGAQYIQTPEMTSLLDRDRKAVLSVVRGEHEDPALAAFCDIARKRQIWLHVGSLPIRLDGQKIANRAFVISPSGDIIARYDKIHMFDVDLANGESWRESAVYQAGGSAVAVDLPWTKIGITICYDLRFPALYRALSETGAEILTVPAAFTHQTGEAHWHVLLRARAIECGCFVLAAAQGGEHEDGRRTYGHSLIVGPWGEILAEGGAKPGILIADIDLSRVKEARQRIPALVHGRRFTLGGQDVPSCLKVVP